MLLSATTFLNIPFAVLTYAFQSLKKKKKKQKRKMKSSFKPEKGLGVYSHVPTAIHQVYEAIKSARNCFVVLSVSFFLFVCYMF